MRPLGKACTRHYPSDPTIASVNSSHTSRLAGSHRVVDSEGGLIESYVPDQFARLRAEGVEVGAEVDMFGASSRRYVDLDRYGWNDVSLYLR